MTRPLFIAEATSHHGGDVKLAKKFVRVAAKSGADFIKFQSWKSNSMCDSGSTKPFVRLRKPAQPALCQYPW